MQEEARQIVERIQSTMDFMLDGGDAEAIKPWLDWQADNIFDNISPDDFTPYEMVALVGLCGPIFARTLCSPVTPPKGRGLRAVV